MNASIMNIQYSTGSGFSFLPKYEKIHVNMKFSVLSLLNFYKIIWLCTKMKNMSRNSWTYSKFRLCKKGSFPSTQSFRSDFSILSFRFIKAGSLDSVELFYQLDEQRSKGRAFYIDVTKQSSLARDTINRRAVTRWGWDET